MTLSKNTKGEDINEQGNNYYETKVQIIVSNMSIISYIFGALNTITNGKNYQNF